MADEEIVIIEGEDEEESESKKAKEDLEKESKGSKKKIIVIVSAISLLLLILIGLILYFLLSKEPKEPKDINSTEITKKILKESIASEAQELSDLEKMIHKANFLYEEGNKQEALSLFEDISSYSEAISNYNLGIAQMKEQNYEDALNSFERAIKNQENRCVSAINAAVCADMLGDEKSFKNYIDLAYEYLPIESDAPLYTYYYGLIMYYKNQYFEALAALEHPSSEFYKKEYDHLKAKIYLALDDSLNALSSIEKHNLEEDRLTLGLLYGRIGEYELAIDNIKSYLEMPERELEASLALALLNLKLGKGGEAGQYLTRAHSLNEENSTKIYPIEVKLKDDIFNLNLAQREFIREFREDDRRVFDLLFYLAPFKVFDAKQTLFYIKKGNVNVFIDEIAEAKGMLKKSRAVSQINSVISKAISKAIDNDLREANRLFESVIDKYSNHSILHYNLALTYAQMGNYSDGYKHFIKSYHLNNRNILSGVFAVMCANLINRDYERILRSVRDDLDLIDDEKSSYYSAFLSFADGNLQGSSKWLERESEPKRALEILLDTIIAQKMGINSILKDRVQRLKKLLPNDPVVATLYLYGNYNELPIKEFAREVQSYIKSNKFNLNSVYGGAEIARYIYINLLRFSGMLNPFRDSLEDAILNYEGDTRGMLQALALSNIYLQDFENAFVNYNTLIDDLNERDAQTIFLASVAAIASKHHENAIALLELSKLIDPTNLESRYALGLLYHEIGNFKGAVIQYNKMKGIDFESDYFDFEIVNN